MPPIQDPLKHDAAAAAARNAIGRVAKNGHPALPHQRHGDIAADHGKAAVREVDEIHHPQRHGQPDRQHEQQHPVGETVEQEADVPRNHGRLHATCRYCFTVSVGVELAVGLHDHFHRDP